MATVFSTRCIPTLSISEEAFFWLRNQTLSPQPREYGLVLPATVIVAVTLSAIFYIAQSRNHTPVSLRAVATSDFVPLGVLFGFRFLCTAVACCTLWSVYTDKTGLTLRYGEAEVVLCRFARWTTFTVWCFTLLLAYFACATVCSGARLFGFDERVPVSLVPLTLVLFEVSYPLSILVTVIVTFGSIPTALRNGYALSRLFRWRPQVMHNGNVLMMQLAMLTAPPPVMLAHFPYAVLCGCAYALFSWVWFWRTGVFYYYFLDYRRPAAVPVYLGLCISLAILHGLSEVLTTVASQADSRWWAVPGIFLLTLTITRFRQPAAGTKR